MKMIRCDVILDPEESVCLILLRMTVSSEKSSHPNRKVWGSPVCTFAAKPKPALFEAADRRVGTFIQ